MALGELSSTQYLKTKLLLAKSIGDSLRTFENLFAFFKQSLETNNLTLNNLCLPLSVAGLGLWGAPHYLNTSRVQRNLPSSCLWLIHISELEPFPAQCFSILGDAAPGGGREWLSGSRGFGAEACI